MANLEQSPGLLELLLDVGDKFRELTAALNRRDSIDVEQPQIEAAREDQ